MPDVTAGNQIRLSLSSPDAGITPRLVLAGPGIPKNPSVHPFIQVPPGSGSIPIPAAPSGRPSYEPFTPMSTYERAEYLDIALVSGEFYAFVYGDQGRDILATGYLVEFSLVDWITIPVQGCPADIPFSK